MRQAQEPFIIPDTEVSSAIHEHPAHVPRINYTALASEDGHHLLRFDTEDEYELNEAGMEPLEIHTSQAGDGVNLVFLSDGCTYLTTSQIIPLWVSQLPALDLTLLHRRSAVEGLGERELMMIERS